MSTKLTDQAFYRHFGEMLGKLRRKRGVSQELLADELKLSRTSVTNIEKGRQPIQLHNLYRIARLLAVDVKDLLPSAGVLEMSQQLENFSVSRSEWLETMNVKLPKPGAYAKKK